jgi:tetratricopeptide (TPR) repeat protein
VFSLIVAARLSVSLWALPVPGGAMTSLPAGATTPEPPRDAEVEEHAAQAHRLYQLGRYQAAIGELRRAYELRADSIYLRDIAEAYRQLGATDQALFYYDRYLSDQPDAADRDEVEERVADLESLRRRPSPGPSPPALLARPSGPPVEARPAPQPPRRVWQRWWFWTAIGAGVAAGVAAALLSPRADTSLPATELGAKKFY